jgi:hypothetical protein
MTAPGDASLREKSRGPNSYLEMAGRTRAIVRLGGANRMVTKGYRKGVYERVTKGINNRHQRVGRVRLFK